MTGAQHRLLTSLEYVLDGLMRRYKERVPDVDKVVRAMVSEQLISLASEIENDHIAFRTMEVPLLGIQSLERIFLNFGYQKRDCYLFEEKKLNAFWYSPPENKYPRIFISELRVGDLSKESQAIIYKYTSQVKEDPTTVIDLNDGSAVDTFLHSPLWSKPTYREFQVLQQESEYAAWVIYNRYYLNHFTVSVHNLPEPYCSVEKFNEFLESYGIKLNNAGGKIKKSPDGLLLQSATVAEMVNAEFDNGQGGVEVQQISGSYVEFAERKVLPAFALLPKSEVGREHRREGFEAKNADKIFESTYTSQTSRDA